MNLGEEDFGLSINDIVSDNKIINSIYDCIEIKPQHIHQ